MQQCDSFLRNLNFLDLQFRTLPALMLEMELRDLLPDTSRRTWLSRVSSQRWRSAIIAHNLLNPFVCLGRTFTANENVITLRGGGSVHTFPFTDDALRHHQLRLLGERVLTPAEQCAKHENIAMRSEQLDL